MADCGCGRSPNGKCVGWHALSEEEYAKRKAQFEKLEENRPAK